MSELPFADVRRFVAKALLAEDAAEESGRSGLDASKLEPSAAYPFLMRGGRGGDAALWGKWN